MSTETDFSRARRIPTELAMGVVAYTIYPVVPRCAIQLAGLASPTDSVSPEGSWRCP